MDFCVKIFKKVLNPAKYHGLWLFFLLKKATNFEIRFKK